MSFLILEQQRLNYADIASNPIPEGLSAYSQQVIKHCQSWLNGQDTFKVSTSGSTGTPQSIRWTRSLIQWSIGNTAHALGLQAGMHALLCMDVQKAGGRMMLFRCLELGMSLEVVPPSSNPLTTAESVRFDFSAMVPIQIHELVVQGQIQQLNRINILLIGGASVSNSLYRTLQTTTSRVYATYGMTETSSHIALRRLNGFESQSGFTALPGVTIHSGAHGQAIIQTPYHPELITHDLIAWNPDGTFLIVGRDNLFINSGGVKIDLQKVEATLSEILHENGIPERLFCAVGKPDEKLGEALCVIVEGEAWDAQTSKVVKDALKLKLPAYEIPKHLVFLHQFILTSSGKLDRKAIAVNAFS